LKYEKSNLIHIQTKDNLVILTHKIDTLIVLITFLKKCEEKKNKRGLYIGTEGIFHLWNEGVPYPVLKPSLTFNTLAGASNPSKLGT